MVVVKESKKFLSNLSMKCWNSAFNAQGSRVTIVVVVQVGAVKIICSSSSGGAHEKGKEGMKLSLPPKLVEKTIVWVSVISFCKISFPVTRLMPYYYAETGKSRPP